MAKPNSAKKSVAWSDLRPLLGRPATDDAVQQLLRRLGKTTTDRDSVVAPADGFEFQLEQPEGAKRNAPFFITSIFLYKGDEKQSAFADLPYGLRYGTRAELVKVMGAPKETWRVGEHDLPRNTPDPDGERWEVDGVNAAAYYRDDLTVRQLVVSLPEDSLNGRSLATHPLHFETKPADAAPDAEYMGMALLVAWALEKHGLPEKHATSAIAAQLLRREVTPRSFLFSACEKTLTTLDVAPVLRDFLVGYTHRTFGSKPERKETDKAIAKLLRLGRADQRYFVDDFLATFKKAVRSPFHVPDSWEAVARLGAVLDSRFADYQATKFQKAPSLKVYEKAAKLRDETSVAATKNVVAKSELGDGYADDFMGLVGRPLSDKGVQAVLRQAQLPVGTRIDEQGNPALGVTYLGAKFDIRGKRVLGVESVTFYGRGQTSYVRGIGAEVEFVGYPAALTKGVRLGDARAVVVKKLGKPTKSADHYDYWRSKERILACAYKKGKLVRLHYGMPADY